MITCWLRQIRISVSSHFMKILFCFISSHKNLISSWSQFHAKPGSEASVLSWSHLILISCWNETELGWDILILTVSLAVKTANTIMSIKINIVISIAAISFRSYVLANEDCKTIKFVCAFNICHKHIWDMWSYENQVTALKNSEVHMSRFFF